MNGICDTKQTTDLTTEKETSTACQCEEKLWRSDKSKNAVAN